MEINKNLIPKDKSLKVKIEFFKEKEKAINEEEKKIIKKFVEKCNKFDESVEIKGVSVGEEYRILETVCKALDLVEKLQKENEELKDFKKQVTEIESTNFIKYKNYISKQEVKDKIEKLNKKEQKLQNSISAEEREEYSDANISWDLMDINIKREVLQELIEEREEE